MEPNANRIFQHTDPDGDRLEIISTKPSRLTVEILTADDHSVMTYITRDGAAVLRSALSVWLGDDTVTEGRAVEVPPPAPTVTAEHRARALDAVSRMAPSGATPERILDAADEMAYWLATGERTGILPVPVPQSMNFIDATSCADAPVAPCPHCSHAFHGSVGCGAGGLGMHRCRCNGVLR